jgi:hypothetical protein
MIQLQNACEETKSTLARAMRTLPTQVNRVEDAPTRKRRAVAEERKRDGEQGDGNGAEA